MSPITTDTGRTLYPVLVLPSAPRLRMWCATSPEAAREADQRLSTMNVGKLTLTEALADCVIVAESEPGRWQLID